MSLTDKQKRELGALTWPILSTIAECGETPASVAYAAFNTGIGMPLDKFEAMMKAFVDAGWVDQRGNCYYPTAVTAPLADFIAKTFGFGDYA